MGSPLAGGMAGGVSRLEEAVAQTARQLDTLHIAYMIIGGFAVTIWGEARLTQDVDVTIQCDTDDTRTIGALATAFRPRVQNPGQFVRDTRVLPVTTTVGVAVDLVFAGLPFESEAIQRAVPVEVSGYLVRVCTPEDLIIMKVISSRPRDREDVRGVIRRQRERLDRRYLDPIVRELAEALAQPDIEEFYISLWHD